MTAQAPTDAELLILCDDLIAAHEPCGECDQLLIARALRTRLSPHLAPEWLEEIQRWLDNYINSDVEWYTLAEQGTVHIRTLLAQFRKATPADANKESAYFAAKLLEGCAINQEAMVGGNITLAAEYRRAALCLRKYYSPPSAEG